MRYRCLGVGLIVEKPVILGVVVAHVGGSLLVGGVHVLLLVHVRRHALLLGRGRHATVDTLRRPHGHQIGTWAGEGRMAAIVCIGRRKIPAHAHLARATVLGSVHAEGVERVSLLRVVVHLVHGRRSMGRSAARGRRSRVVLGLRVSYLLGRSCLGVLADRKSVV